MSEFHQPDHIGQAVEELLTQHRHPVMQGFVEGIAVSVQRLEDTALALRFDRLIANAIGAQLDQLGAIVGEDRGTLDDDDYRAFIGARILLNRSEGKTDQLIDLFRRVTGTLTVELTEHGHMDYQLLIVDAAFTAARSARIAQFMDLARPSCYGAAIAVGIEPVFRFDSGPGFDIGQGQLAGVIA